MKVKLNLSRKIALAVASITLVLCLIIGLMSIATSKNSLLKETEKTLTQLSEEGSKYVELSIENYTNILEGFAKRQSIIDMDYESISSSLREEIQELGYEDVALVTPDRQAHYIIEDVFLDVSDRGSVDQAFDGKSNVSDVTIDQVSGNTVVLYTVPVKNDGQIVGVLIGRAPGSDLNLITDEMKFGDKGYAFIMDNDGVFYAHPDDELVLSQKSALEEENFKDFASSLSKLGEDRTGLIEYKINNVDHYSYINPVAVNDWNIAIVIPKDEALSGLTSLQFNIFIITIIMIVLGVIAALFLGRYISNPIIAISAMITKFANYDLTVDTNSKTAVRFLSRNDEIGVIAHALKTMQGNLVSIISDISNASGQLASSSEELNATTDQSSSASNEVARAIEDIAHGATEQARDTESGAMGIQELGDQITSTQKGIDSLYESSREINNLKDEGLLVIDELITKTDRSNETTKEIYEVINETNDSAQKINSASEMIKSIAEQTNLLALNAAIEAARAGDSGRGFAVVAEEIRVLAEESSSFTAEISNVIDELIGKTKDSLTTMKEMAEIATSQTESVNITNNKFEGIAKAIESMNNLMNEIHESGQSMEDKKDEIVTLVENLSAISQENAAGTEEASASVEEQSASIIEIANSSESLAKLAEDMNEIISKFKY